MTSLGSLSQGGRTVEFMRYIALLGKQKSLYGHFSGESNGEGSFWEDSVKISLRK